MNSKILSWYGQFKLPNFGKETFPKLNPQDIKNLPIVNCSNVNHKAIADKADKMLELKKVNTGLRF